MQRTNHRDRWVKRILFALVLAFSLGMGRAEAAALPALQVKGTRLTTAGGRAVQLRGVSTHGFSWYPQFANRKAFAYMKKNWKINVVRLAMYPAEYNGYCTGGAANRQKLETAVENGIRAATDAGLYVIVDWHILSDGNPRKYQSQAVSFFKKIAKKYRSYTNVIYEICNEPNGVTWSTVRAYANTVVKAIRVYDKDAVILVGTPTWSQDVDIAARNPLRGYRNVMYTLHFYAGTHGQALRTKALKAIRAGLPLFVSEFGITGSSGRGALYRAQGQKWLDFLDRYGISYVAWNLSNKAEGSALIRPSCRKTSGWSSRELSPWGTWLTAQLRKH